MKAKWCRDLLDSVERLLVGKNIPSFKWKDEHKQTLKEIAELERLAEIGQAVEWNLGYGKNKWGSLTDYDDLEQCLEDYRKEQGD